MTNTRLFNKKEIGLISLFLITIVLLFYSSIVYSRMRERDLSRQKDITSVKNAIDVFYSSYGFYPPSEDGYIKACSSQGSDFKLGVSSASKSANSYLDFANIAVDCVWGEDNLLEDVADSNTVVITLPSDPLGTDNQYSYVSDGKYYAVLANMETTTIEDYDTKTAELNINCGKKTCDYAKSSLTLENLMFKYQNGYR